MSHKSKLSFSSKNLPTVRVFNLAFSPVASKEAMKKLLKSPEKIIVWDPWANFEISGGNF